jgi:predicted O-linked N-acetylglucosamine transferase (SPINDLY family)
MLNKMSDGSLSVWSSILGLLPTAHLRLQNWQFDYPDANDDMRNRLTAFNIDLARVTLHGGAPRDMYLAAYAEVDVVLDTFPFPGGTTTAEALWMGVPTLTLTGRTLLERQGESLLRSAGLGNWVASSEQEYIDLALKHVSDLTSLTELRAELRSRVMKSPLFDGRRFAYQLEEAFTEMARSKITQGTCTSRECQT